MRADEGGGRMRADKRGGEGRGQVPSINLQHAPTHACIHAANNMQHATVRAGTQPSSPAAARCRP
eukprot:350235-Chlamydomonas_euryale.AAC.14